MHSPEPSHRGTATAGEQLSRHLHTQAADFLRSLRLHSESGADTAAAAEAARALRASSRRIGGALATFRPLLDPSWADGLRTELSWLSAVLAQEHDCTARLLRLMDALSRLSGTSPVPPARAELRPLGRDAAGGPPGGRAPATGGARDAAGSPPGGSAPGGAAPTAPAGSGAGTVPQADGASAAAVHPAAAGTAPAGGAADHPVLALRPAGRATAGPVTADARTTTPTAGGPADAAGSQADPVPGAGTPREAAPPGPRGGGPGAPPRAGAARGALAVGVARAGALLERRLTLARTRAHSAALGALGSARFHAVADAVALLASDLPLAPAAAGPAGPADETLPLLAGLAERRLLDAVARLPLSRAAHPYNAEALGGGLGTEPDDAAQQDAPWHEVRRLLRLHRYAQEAARPGAAPVLLRAALLLDHHRDAAEAAEAAAAAARTPRIAPATAYALGVLHADQRHEVEAARFAFQQEWRHTTTAVPAP